MMKPIEKDGLQTIEILSKNMTKTFFDIRYLAKYKHSGYLTSKAPEVEFLNACLTDSKVVETGMEIAAAFLSEASEEHIWKESKRYRADLASRPEVSHYVSEELKGKSYLGDGSEVEILFSYCIGLVTNQREEATLLSKVMKWLVDADWTGFVLAFQPSDSLLKEMITSQAFSQEYLAEKMGRRGLDINSMATAFSNLALAEKIRRVNSPMFEGEFYMMSDYLDFLTVILSRNGRFDLMVQLLDKYSIPEIQLVVIQMLRNPEEHLALFEAVSKSAVEHEKKRVLQQLIINCWEGNLIQIKSNYGMSLQPPYADSNKLNEIWNALRDEFEKTLLSTIETSLKLFLETLPSEELTYWLFTLPYPNPSIENEHNKAQRLILDMSRNALMNIVSSDGIKTDIPDLAYLEAWAEYFENIEDEGIQSKIADSILNSLQSDKYYLGGDINNDLISRIHYLSYAILKGLGKEAGEIFDIHHQDFRVIFEGIRPTPQKERYDKAYFESQFLMILLYSVVFNENISQKKNDFLRIAEYTLLQCNYGHSGNYDTFHYIRAIIFAEMIVSQVMPEIKEAFEYLCIKNYPYVYPLLRVFNVGKGSLSPTASSWLKCQYTQEWPVLKARMGSRGQKNEVDWAKRVFDSLLLEEHTATK